MLLKSKLDAAFDEATNLYTHLAARDGHASDTSSSMQSQNRESISSSDSECANHRRLDVTRAVSECSMTDDDDDGDDRVGRILYGLDTQSSLSAEDLKLEMDVLEAEYNLLRVRKKLALQNRSNGCVERNNAAPHGTQALCISSVHPIPMEGEKQGDHGGAVYKIQPKETPPNLLEDMGDMVCSQSRFAQEALGRLREISSENACRMPQEDPTFALQDRLQKLLLAAVLEHECPVHSSFQPGCKDAWDTSYRFGTARVQKDAIWNNLLKDKKCLNDSAAHRKELDLRSSKDEQAKVALAMQKEENRYCFRSRSQQTLAEEMYCKETIRRIVQQVEAELEQWSQMQDILCNLQRELEGLSELQKLWEDRALRAEAQLKCLQEDVHEWRCRARTSEEELVILRCEKQILKNKIDMIEDAQMNPSGVAREVLEKPRCASVGMQREDFAVCESFVHSRNESGRSSVDLGTSSTQRSFRKSIKKSLEFVSSSKNSSNPSKFLFGNLGLPKGEPTRLEFSSKRVDVANSKGKPKSSKPSGQYIKLNTLKPDSCESTYGHDHKERKKARLFASSKENRQVTVSCSAINPSISENAQDGLPLNAPGQDYTGGLFSTKPKSSWPSAPQSTPSRIPFGEIVNLSRHVKN